MVNKYNNLNDEKKLEANSDIKNNVKNDDIIANAYEGRDKAFMDVDRMVNEGLGGGMVTEHNGLIEETTTDTMLQYDEKKTENRKR